MVFRPFSWLHRCLLFYPRIFHNSPWFASQFSMVFFDLWLAFINVLIVCIVFANAFASKVYSVFTSVRPTIWYMWFILGFHLPSFLDSFPPSLPASLPACLPSFLPAFLPSLFFHWSLFFWSLMCFFDPHYFCRCLRRKTSQLAETLTLLQSKQDTHCDKLVLRLDTSNFAILWESVGLSHRRYSLWPFGKLLNDIGIKCTHSSLILQEMKGNPGMMSVQGTHMVWYPY